MDEIKSRLRLSDVIGRTVKLRRSGREYVGLSPFAKEKTPSFYVNDEKGFFHDFSSGKHGDLISFLQETERLTFPEAVERLAAEAGVPMPAADPVAAREEQKRAGLGEWLELAARWFEAELRRPAGEAARAYLVRRALPEADWTRFRLGYAPSGRTMLKDYLVAKGAKPAELVEAGILIAPEDGGAPYDRFRDRVIFPITDGRGRVVSFGGRALDSEAKAKYLNGPETSLFHKGMLLYGLPEARRLMHATQVKAGAAETAPLVVVEGYMDVIACQRAEIAAVAPLGTALTEAQIELLWRVHPSPTLCFDADAAGRRAAARSIERALPLIKPGRSFKFSALAGGKDPDDVLRDQGKAVLAAQLNETKPLVQVLFEIENPGLDGLKTPEERAGFKVRLRKLAATIADADLSQEYRQDLLARYEALWPLAQAAHTYSDAARSLGKRRWEVQPRWKVAPATPEGKAAARKLSESVRPLSAALAKGAIEHPVVIGDRVEVLAIQGFLDPKLNELAAEMVQLSYQSDQLDSEWLKRHFAQRGWQPLVQEIFVQAAKAGVAAPFLELGLQAERVRLLWSKAFDLLVEVNRLELALAEVLRELDAIYRGSGELDTAELVSLLPHRDEVRAEMTQLKSDREALWRDVRSGTVWDRDVSLGRASAEWQTIH